MTLRHAAALALVGWYLMVSPFVERGLDPHFLGTPAVWGVYDLSGCNAEARRLMFLLAEHREDILARYDAVYRLTCIDERNVELLRQRHNLTYMSGIQKHDLTSEPSTSKPATPPNSK
jgi:hypothetical protein